MATTTLDQQRAAYAWSCAAQRVKEPQFKDYRNLAKGAPALVMGSGLMAALAFWKSRDAKQTHAHALAKDVLVWLKQSRQVPADFAQAMTLMSQQASSSQYMALTDEVLALLRWLRQFADAVEVK